MRVIAGEYKGRKLVTFRGQQLRPLTDRIKTSVFDYLQEKPKKSRILDLFSGTGSFGIEALSREADFIVFVEKYKPAIELILKNLNTINCNPEKYCILCSDTLKFLRSPGKWQHQFDIIFADPPFNYKHFENLIDAAASFRYLKKNGLFIIRHQSSLCLEINEKGRFKLINFKKYGDSLVKFFINTGV